MTEPRSAAEHALERIARAGAANLAGSVVSAGCSFALVVIVTRGYDLADAGALFATVSVFLILLATVELGADQGFVRFISWLRARGEHADIPVVLRTGFRVALTTAVAIAVVGFVSAGAVAGLLAGGEDPDRVAAMLTVMCAALPFAAGYELLLAVTRGYGAMLPTVFIDRLVRPILQVAFVTVAATSGAGISGLAVAWVAPYAVGLILAGAAVRRTRAAPPGFTAPNPSATSMFWRFTAARGVARVCQVGLQRIDVVLVAALRGPRDAAVYTAVTRFVVLGQLAIQAITQVLQPRIAELLATGDRAAVGTILRQVTVWLVALVWPLYLMLAVHAEALVAVFGADYGRGAAGLALISIAMLAAIAAGPVDVVLTMAGRSGLSLANTGAALAVNVVLCLLLVPDYGVIGAAAAWAGAILLRNGLAVVQVRAHVGVTAASRTGALVAIAATLGLGVLPWLGSFADGWPAVLTTVLGAAGYLGLLWRHRDTISTPALNLAHRTRRRASR